MRGLGIGGVAVAAALVAGGAFGQEPAPGVAPPAPPGATPVTPPLPPGVRIVSGQSAVVGENAAAARERALDEALRQAVDQALSEMLGPGARTADAKGVRALEARARSFVRRYRALEEGEANGVYAIRLEAEVDDAALRRAADRLAVAPPVPSGNAAATPAAAGLLLVPAGATGIVPSLAAAVNAAGGRAQVGEASADVGAAQRAAARASMSEIAFVSGEIADEGAVRGTAKVAVSCRVSARVVAVTSGLPIAQHAVAPRAFADSDEVARADCLARAAADLAPRLIPAGGGGVASGADLRTVTVEADVVEPAAVPALLRSVRSVGAVSSAELRRISAGRAEVRVRTRTPPPALALALSRDTSSVITLSGAEAAGDVIRVRVRLKPPAATTGAP
jgi:hypothetical protein